MSDSTQTSDAFSQAALDALFAFDQQADASGPTRGMAALVDVAVANTERLPLLEVLFDRLVRGLSTALRNFTSDAVEASLDRFESMRFDDFTNTLSLPLVLGVFRADEWDNHGLIAIDATLVYAVVDALMGGRRGTSPIKIDGRPFTTLEMRFIERMIDLILRELSAVFEPISPVTFRLERTETSPRFALIARPTNTVAVARMRVDMDERGGRFAVMLPYSTLEPIRTLLVQRFTGEKLGRDSAWEAAVAATVRDVPIEVAAVLAETDLPLRHAMELKAGQTIRFPASDQPPIELRSAGSLLGHGRLYQDGGRCVMSIEAAGELVR